MAYSTRKSRFAVVEEVTEGTPVAPSSGSNYIALQEGFTMVPSFEVIENRELKASIGVAPSILGLENPSASLDHYIRHSHVEGTAPNFGVLLKAAFGATVAYSGTERVTTTGSSAGSSTAAAVINLAAGGTDFERGKAILIKDGTNGYSIRPVRSVSTNALTLLFNLANAPATGISVGKPVFYKPSDTPPSVTLWCFRGNEADIEMIRGAKVSEMSITAEAGSELNGSFTFQGVAYHFDPIEILAADTKLDFEDDSTPLTATITAKVYKDPHDLAAAIQSAMNGLGSSNTFTCTYSDSTGKFTITSDGTTLELNWNTGSNTANTIGDKIGFSTAADDTGALTYTSDNAQSWASYQTPSIDAGQPLVVKNNELMLGDFDDYGCSGAQSATITLTNEIGQVRDICAESGVSGTVNNRRQCSIELLLTLTKHDADKFKRYRAGDTLSFSFSFGSKSGGNWEAGKCGNICAPDCKVIAFEVTDTDGIVTMAVTLEPFVDSSGNGEVFLTFL